jgi:hypothetical protein
VAADIAAAAGHQNGHRHLVIARRLLDMSPYRKHMKARFRMRSPRFYA